jgi:hypothetical protein
MPGFEAVNDTCVIISDMQDAHSVVLFLLVVAEILVCACAVSWWKKHNVHYMRLAHI